MRSVARTAIIGLCALALSGAVTGAYAQRAARPDRQVQRTRLERLADVLELSQDQIDRLEELRDQGFSQMADLRKEMARVDNDMRGEMLKDNPSEAALKKLVAKRSDIRGEMEMMQLEHRLAMRDILTQEQRDKLMMLRGSGRGRGAWGGFGDGSRGFRGRGMRGGRGMGGPGRGMGMRGDGPCLGLGFDGMGPGYGCLGPWWDDFGPAPYADDDDE
jgi:Spy/CpxP family protein refolding chaperone